MINTLEDEMVGLQDFFQRGVVLEGLRNEAYSFVADLVVAKAALESVTNANTLIDKGLT